MKTAAVVPTHLSSVFPGTKVYLVSKEGQKFYLLHDFTPSADMPLGELTFMPANVSTKWTPSSLKLVADWLNMLSDGKLTSSDLNQCVTRLKTQGGAGSPLDPTGQTLNFLKLSQTESAVGGCYWLSNKRNVGFGFTGKGKY